MAITEKLNTAWADNQMQDALFEYRALVQAFYWQIQETINKGAEILARPVFANVDTEIKTEGVAVKNIIVACKTSLDAHTEFLNWSQP